MDIQVEGHNNRVAGRDYLELNAQLTLTPEQLKALAIKPCPTCEQRVITPSAEMCNHCHREQTAQALKTRAGAVALIVLMVWGWLLHKRGPDADLLQFAETFLNAGAIVLCGALLLEIFKLWWVCYSADFFTAIWRGLAQLTTRGRR